MKNQFHTPETWDRRDRGQGISSETHELIRELSFLHKPLGKIFNDSMHRRYKSAADVVADALRNTARMLSNRSAVLVKYDLASHFKDITDADAEKEKRIAQRIADSITPAELDDAKHEMSDFLKELRRR